MHCRRLLAIITLMFSLQQPLLAQFDSSYIESYSGKLVGRFLVNRKYTTMNITSSSRNYSLRYRPNKTFSAGLGASYRFATLNLTFGILQPQENRGRTRDFDLQIHKYGRKFTTDLLLQMYKGFYLSDRSFSLPDEDFYVRPDLSVNAIGGTFQYIVNHRKFSYRAVFQQTEFQKRSAGSFLLGFELYVGRFKGDSSLIPRKAIVDAPSEEINKMRFLEFGPNGGYAYTWVYKNLFLMASASVSLNASINQVSNEKGSQNFVGVSPNTFFRVSTGYNKPKWGVNLIMITTGLHFPVFEDRTFNVNSGRYRMNFIYRFSPSRKTKRYLKVIDDVDDFIRG